MNQMIKQPILAMSDSFFEAFAKLPAQIRRKVQFFMSKFRQQATSRGINYEKLTDAAVPNFRSARIDDNYRAIVFHPNEGNVYLLLWIDTHDEAYRWARTHTCSLNSSLGTIQVYETLDYVSDGNASSEKRQAVDPTAAPAPEQIAVVPQAAPAAKAPEQNAVAVQMDPVQEKLFAQFSREDLASVGVPQDRLDRVMSLQDKEALDEFRNKLPVDAYESLVWLADGESLVEVQQAYAPARATDDFETALKNERTQRSFLVVETDEEMQKVVNASLEKWRIFLHPAQRRLVKRQAVTPMMVRGAAGTGKTVVAIHRAAELLSRSDWDASRKLLFTTFTRNLAVDIEQQLRSLCSLEQFRRIEVFNLDRWVSDFLRRQQVRLDIVYPDSQRYEQCWKSAMSLASLDFPESFYEEEWQRVILPQEITSEAQYLKAPRKGRGKALGRNDKKKIWAVFEEMRDMLGKHGCITSEDAFFMAATMIRKNPELVNYGAVIVDETQDFSSAALSLLAAIATVVPGEEPRIFLVGDGQQRIYGRTASLSACGINVRGRRSERLKIMYRTTEEIRRAAEKVLAGERFDDMDEGNETRLGSISNRHGAVPLLYQASRIDEEVDWVCNQIRTLTGSEDIPEERRLKLRDICIITRQQKGIDRYMSFVQEHGFKTHRVSRNTPDDPGIDGIRFATMHRVKGLEFKAVFIVGANEGIMPQQVSGKSEDDTEIRIAQLSERSLFYVAASRARDALFVSCCGNPGLFFKMLDKTMTQ